MGLNVEEPTGLIDRLGAAMNSRRWDLLDDIVAPNFVRHCPATPGVAVRNLQEFKDYLKQDVAVFPDSIQTVRRQVAEGDWVAIWATYEGTQEGPMGPFPPSGRKMCLDFAAFMRIEAGRIAEMWVTWDNMAALAQLGHLPPGPPTGA